MTIVKYNNKKYDFHWRSVVLFFIFCPQIALSIYILFESLWVYTHPPFIYPIVGLLNLLTGQTTTFYKSTSLHMYLFYIPDRPIVGFISDCSGIHGYVIYAGICLMTPHNKFKDENTNIWKRKFFTFLIPSLLFLFENILRTSITLLLYYKGVPFHPMHEYIGYFTTFFAVFVFYVISYFWLPEFSLFAIWIKDSIKERISKKSMEEKDKKEANRSLVIAIWTVIAIVLIIVFSILVVQ